MNQPLPLPLILIGDDTPDEIRRRVENCCYVLGKNDHQLPAEHYSTPGSVATPNAEIRWSQSPNAADYIAMARARRTLLILDIAWTGISEVQGLKIAGEMLADTDFVDRSVVVLKSTEKAGSAASWATPRTLAMRQLRVSQTVRLRLLAANRTVGGEPDRYEQGILSQALLDLQEEAIFDAMSRGEWSAADVGKAIDQIVAADFYGAFSGDKALGKLYSLRVLRRYHQRLTPSYPQGPLNIGIAHLIGDNSKLPGTLADVAKSLTTGRKEDRESAAVVSALLDYGEVASVERLLFALPLKAKTRVEIRTDFDEQTWNPGKIALVKVIKRGCDLSEARMALSQLCTALEFCSRDKLEPVKALRDALHPGRIPDILESNRLIAEMRSVVLIDLPAAIAEMVESLFSDIERALVEGVLPNSEGISELRSAQAPEFLTLDLHFRDPNALRIKSENKRVRLLNRRLFEHPAPEAARILSTAQSSPEGIVLALKTYIQSPEAIAALVELLSTEPTAFDECVAKLAKTDADVRLPSSFDSFDKFWCERWRGKSPPPVLRYLQEHGLEEGEFAEEVKQWNEALQQRDPEKGDDVRPIPPIEPLKISLLELLTAHLAILEYRIRSFGIIIAHAAVTSEWKVDAPANLAELWRDRGWDRIFSKGGVTDPERKSCLPKLEWTGQILHALLKHPQAKSCYDGFRQFLMDYEVQVGRDETTGKPVLAYKSPLPAWLRVGNLALPLIVIRRNPIDRHIALPEQKHRGGDIEAVRDDGDSSDPRNQVDVAEEADLVARCKAGDASACDALVKECGWKPDRVAKLRKSARGD